MDSNPYNDTYAQASEYFRLALALLAKHKVPPSPLNFRLGYDSVAGASTDLQAAFDALLKQSNEPSAEELWKLYRGAFIQNDEALDSMRQELRRIITSMQGQFVQSGDKLSSYSETLGHFADLLDTSPAPEIMSAEVNKVIEDTRANERSQRELGKQLSHIVSEVSSLRDELEQVRQESLTDTLTGISNRKAFDASLEQNIHTAREQQSPFCVLLVDIDHFKQFNDTHGHLVGDKVLRFVASTLKRSVKGKDMVARFGGEEFVIILPQTEVEGAETVAEHVRQAISSGQLKDKQSDESYGRVTVSIGVAQFTMSDLPNDIVQRADRGLYLAKERGRDRVEKVA